MYDNGVASSIYFSQIMVTTRNPTLDRLSVGACLGGEPFPIDLRKTKLRFGVLNEDDVDHGAEVSEQRIEHCAFGTEAETKPIIKGKAYAGL
jgi:hypothetical protein